jgi:hypothetical protein
VWTLTPFAVLLVGAAAAAALRFPFSPERRGGRWCSAASPPTPVLAAPRVALMNAGAENEEEKEEQEGETF